MTGTRILVVTDDAGLGDLLESALAKERYHCRRSPALTAVDEARQLAPHAVLLDLMPPKAAASVHARLVGESLGPRTPLLILSALGESEALRHLRFDARTYHVPKPFHPELMVAVLRQSLAISGA